MSRHNRKIKDILLNKKITKFYFVIYIAISFYLRKDFFYRDPIPYFTMLFPIILGTVFLYSGIISLKEEKAGFYSSDYRGKTAIFFGIVSIIASLVFMIFVWT